MKRAYTSLLLLVLLFAACKDTGEDTPDGPFNPVDTSFTHDRLVIPGNGFAYEVLFRKGDNVRAEWRDTLTYAKGKLDLLVWLPIDGAADHGILWTNHEETKAHHDVLLDGGGATVMEMHRDSAGDWSVVGFPHAIDFTPVGGTMTNCLGAPTPWGTVLTSEEVEPPSNRALHPDSASAILRDTSDVAGWARWKNYGWMVEVDPYTRKALGKRYAMGRFMHEGAYCMPDNRTVYLMDDYGPGCLFKFVADRPKDLSEGRLYAYKQSADLQSGAWLPLPRGRDSLLYARKYACMAGATIFIRPEDIEMMKDGTFLITETGLDSTDLSQAIAWGGTPAKHLERFHVGEGIYDDKFGRLLRLDPKTNKVSVYLEAGPAEEEKGLHFSNPDNMAIDERRNMVVICEDLVGVSHGRMPAQHRGRVINEVYILDLDIKTPRIDDLRRFAVAPPGAEGTGPVWNTDYSALFLNFQHPSPSNPEPFNRDATVVITGWK